MILYSRSTMIVTTTFIAAIIFTTNADNTTTAGNITVHLMCICYWNFCCRTNTVTGRLNTNSSYTATVFTATGINQSVFTVRLHVMQRTVFLWKFCPSVRLSVRPTNACTLHCNKTKQSSVNMSTTHERRIFQFLVI